MRVRRSKALIGRRRKFRTKNSPRISKRKADRELHTFRVVESRPPCLELELAFYGERSRGNFGSEKTLLCRPVEDACAVAEALDRRRGDRS